MPPPTSADQQRWTGTIEEHLSTAESYLDRLRDALRERNLTGAFLIAHAIYAHTLQAFRKFKLDPRRN